MTPSRAGAMVCVLILVLAGCDTATEPAPGGTGSDGVFILNEGAYLAGNAELSFYDISTGTVSGNLYSAANDGATLGDVANAMVRQGERLIIAVNNSARLDIVDILTHRSLGRIQLPGLPRQIAVAGSDKAYVTMQDSTIAIVDLQQMSYVRSISTGPFPDGVVRTQGRVFILNSGFGSGSSISVIDEASDSVVATIRTPDGPTYAALGPDGRIYTVCTGRSDFSDPSNDTPGAVLVIDPASFQIVDSLSIDGHPGKFVLDSMGSIYILGPGPYPSTPVWKLESVPSLRIVTTSLVEGSFYGIGINEGRKELYLADAGSFQTNGSVVITALDGSGRSVLNSGIGIAPHAFIVVDR